MLPTHRLYSTLLKSALLSLTLIGNSFAAPERVLVSIKPLHSLISHITEGINQTELLLDRQQSAHHFQLRPSQKRLINQSDIFFYSSDNIEYFVAALKNTSDNIEFIELAQAPGLKVLPVRGFHDHDNHQPTDADIDGHIWLSIENAQHISRYIAAILSKRAPQYAQQYENNLKILLNKLSALKKVNLALLSKIKEIPFLVYHDAYQYFEHENELSGAHFITTSAEHSLGIKRVRSLKQLIKNKNIQCIFYEPPNIPPLITILTENNATRLAAIDPAGIQLEAGKQHYFNLLQQTTQTLFDCLGTR